MVLRNTADSFGLISRLLHWIMAFGVIFMLALGNRIADLKPDLSTLYLYGAHKTLGMVILTLAVLRLIWHRFSPPPHPIGTPSSSVERIAMNSGPTGSPRRPHSVFRSAVHRSPIRP